MSAGIRLSFTLAEGTVLFAFELIRAAPSQQPGPRTFNYQGCLSPAAKARPYCDPSLSIDQRVTSLVSSLNLSEKTSRMSTDPRASAIPRVGLPQYAWLMETNTAMSAACLNNTRCATNFVGPNGLAF